MVRPGTLWACLAVLWLLLVAFGTAKLEIFASTPGPSATTAKSAAGQRYHLYAFLHPDCPCSKATVTELQKILEHAQTPIDVIAVIDTAGLDPSAAAPLEASLAQTPSIAIEHDPDGARTASFGAKTSGEVLVYEPRGGLVFSGGITAARGHEGDNAGSTAIESILSGKTPETRHTPTYGCSLSPAMRVK